MSYASGMDWPSRKRQSTTSATDLQRQVRNGSSILGNEEDDLLFDELDQDLQSNAPSRASTTSTASSEKYIYSKALLNLNASRMAPSAIRPEWIPKHFRAMLAATTSISAYHPESFMLGTNLSAAAAVTSFGGGSAGLVAMGEGDAEGNFLGFMAQSLCFNHPLSVWHISTPFEDQRHSLLKLQQASAATTTDATDVGEHDSMPPPPPPVLTHNGITTRATCSMYTLMPFCQLRLLISNMAQTDRTTSRYEAHHSLFTRLVLNDDVWLKDCHRISSLWQHQLRAATSSSSTLVRRRAASSSNTHMLSSSGMSTPTTNTSTMSSYFSNLSTTSSAAAAGSATSAMSSTSYAGALNFALPPHSLIFAQLAAFSRDLFSAAKTSNSIVYGVILFVLFLVQHHPVFMIKDVDSSHDLITNNGNHSAAQIPQPPPRLNLSSMWYMIFNMTPQSNSYTRRQLLIDLFNKESTWTALVMLIFSASSSSANERLREATSVYDANDTFRNTATFGYPIDEAMRSKLVLGDWLMSVLDVTRPHIFSSSPSYLQYVGEKLSPWSRSNGIIMEEMRSGNGSSYSAASTKATTHLMNNILEEWRQLAIDGLAWLNNDVNLLDMIVD